MHPVVLSRNGARATRPTKPLPAKGCPPFRPPTEVLERIIDWVAALRNVENKRALYYGTLLACSLVCRACYPRSRMQLFRSVHLPSERHLVQLLRSLKVNGRNGDHVEALYVDASHGVNQSWFQLLPFALGPRLRNLTFLSIRSSVFRNPMHPYFYKALPLFHSVTSLELSRITCDHLGHVSRLLRTMPSLVSVRMEMVSDVLGPNPRHTILRRRVADIEELHIRISEDVLHRLLNPPSFRASVLSSVYIQLDASFNKKLGTLCDAMQSIGSLVRESGRALRKFFLVVDWERGGWYHEAIPAIISRMSFLSAILYHFLYTSAKLTMVPPQNISVSPRTRTSTNSDSCAGRSRPAPDLCSPWATSSPPSLLRPSPPSFSASGPRARTQTCPLSAGTRSKTRLSPAPRTPKSGWKCFTTRRTLCVCRGCLCAGCCWRWMGG